MTKQEYIEGINKLAFMVHESYIHPECWDNQLFITTLGQVNFERLEDHGEITTILGDTFQYKFNSAKIINGKLVYGHLDKRPGEFEWNSNEQSI